MEKRCECCGNTFNARKKTARFCSRACRNNALGSPQLYRCDYCGKEFKVSSTKIKELASGKRKHLCCSKSCFDNIQGHSFDDVKELFDRRGYILLTNEKLMAKEKYKYICPRHTNRGTQEITYNNLKNGHGCRYCGFERTAEAKKPNISDIKSLFLERGMVVVDDVYVDSHTPIKYICQKHPECGIQKIAYTNFLAGQGCPHCSMSKGEKLIAKYLEDNRIHFFTQKKFNDLCGVNGKLLSYDFFIPDGNLLIEFQGEFHDGTARIQTNTGYMIQQEHDKRKREYAESHGYDLLEIWYFQKDNIEQILSKALHLSVETAGCSQ